MMVVSFIILIWTLDPAFWREHYEQVEEQVHVDLPSTCLDVQTSMPSFSFVVGANTTLKDGSRRRRPYR
jgi:hypothetical protein